MEKKPESIQKKKTEITQIILTIGDKEVSLTLEETRRLYETLANLLGHGLPIYASYSPTPYAWWTGTATPSISYTISTSHS